jgi:hypothetical protein
MQMNVKKMLMRGGRGSAWAAVAACAAVLLAGCDKPEAPVARPDTAAGAAANVARQATQQLDQVASFVNQQVDSAKAGVASAASAVPPLTASAVASAAQAQINADASAVLGQAASEAGAQLAEAGRKLQQWSRPGASGAASASPASGH